MGEKSLTNLYYRWLTGFVGSYYNGLRYEFLLNRLFQRSYVWDNELDENLAVNGMDMRKEYYVSTPTIEKMVEIYGEFEEDCSILEMMIALSRSIEDNVMTDFYENRTSLWFWGMLETLGALKYDDNRYNEAEVDAILDRFLAKKYLRDGSGGLFLTKNSQIDMRKMDIWMQMMTFLNENY